MTARALGAILVTTLACRTTAAPSASANSARGTAPAQLLGAFEDDYGLTYRISPDVWQQGTRTRYLVTEWHVDSQYLLARNGPENSSAPGKWTRIDWMPLDGMAPFTWAYCLSAYESPTREDAQATRIAERSNPKTGCNRFPFSRMKRAAAPGSR